MVVRASGSGHRESGRLQRAGWSRNQPPKSSGCVSARDTGAEAPSMERAISASSQTFRKGPGGKRDFESLVVFT